MLKCTAADIAAGTAEPGHIVGSYSAAAAEDTGCSVDWSSRTAGCTVDPYLLCVCQGGMATEHRAMS